jgi:hypothetical protein
MSAHLQGNIITYMHIHGNNYIHMLYSCLDMHEHMEQQSHTVQSLNNTLTDLCCIHNQWNHGEITVFDSTYTRDTHTRPLTWWAYVILLLLLPYLTQAHCIRIQIIQYNIIPPHIHYIKGRTHTHIQNH